MFCCDTFPPPFGGVPSLRNDLPLKQVAFLKGASEVYPELITRKNQSRVLHQSPIELLPRLTRVT